MTEFCKTPYPKVTSNEVWIKINIEHEPAPAFDIGYF